jgi:hypothetical protein
LQADARSLVATLLAKGNLDGLVAASRIDRAVADEGGLVGLSPEQRDAVLAALEEAESPGLAEVRGALARDFEHRRRGQSG